MDDKSETVVVAVDTNLDTSLVVISKRSATIADVRESIRTTHMTLYPQYGLININAVKVEMFSRHYQLEDSHSIGQIFRGWQGSLRVEVTWHTSRLHKSSSTPRLKSSSMVNEECPLSYGKICELLLAGDHKQHPMLSTLEAHFGRSQVPRLPSASPIIGTCNVNAPEGKDIGDFQKNHDSASKDREEHHEQRPGLAFYGDNVGPILSTGPSLHRISLENDVAWKESVKHGKTVTLQRDWRSKSLSPKGNSNDDWRQVLAQANAKEAALDRALKTATTLALMEASNNHGSKTPVPEVNVPVPAMKAPLTVYEGLNGEPVVSGILGGSDNYGSGEGGPLGKRKRKSGELAGLTGFGSHHGANGTTEEVDGRIVERATKKVKGESILDQSTDKIPESNAISVPVDGEGNTEMKTTRVEAQTIRSSSRESEGQTPPKQKTTFTSQQSDKMETLMTTLNRKKLSGGMLKQCLPLKSVNKSRNCNTKRNLEVEMGNSENSGASKDGTEIGHGRDSDVIEKRSWNLPHVSKSQLEGKASPSEGVKGAVKQQHPLKVDIKWHSSGSTTQESNGMSQSERPEQKKLTELRKSDRRHEKHGQNREEASSSESSKSYRPQGSCETKKVEDVVKKLVDLYSPRKSSVHTRSTSEDSTSSEENQDIQPTVSILKGDSPAQALDDADGGPLVNSGRRSRGSSALDTKFQHFIDSQDGLDEILGITLSQRKSKASSRLLQEVWLPSIPKDSIAPTSLVDDSLTIDIVPDTQVVTINDSHEFPIGQTGETSLQEKKREGKPLERTGGIKLATDSSHMSNDMEEERRRSEGGSKLPGLLKRVDTTGNTAHVMKSFPTTVSMVGGRFESNKDPLLPKSADDSQQFQAAVQLTMLSMAEEGGKQSAFQESRMQSSKNIFIEQVAKKNEQSVIGKNLDELADLPRNVVSSAHKESRVVKSPFEDVHRGVSASLGDLADCLGEYDGYCRPENVVADKKHFLGGLSQGNSGLVRDPDKESGNHDKGELATPHQVFEKEKKLSVGKVRDGKTPRNRSKSKDEQGILKKADAEIASLPKTIGSVEPGNGFLQGPGSEPDEGNLEDNYQEHEGRVNGNSGSLISKNLHETDSLGKREKVINGFGCIKFTEEEREMVLQEKSVWKKQKDKNRKVKRLKSPEELDKGEVTEKETPRPKRVKGDSARDISECDDNPPTKARMGRVEVECVEGPNLEGESVRNGQEDGVNLFSVMPTKKKKRKKKVSLKGNLQIEVSDLRTSPGIAEDYLGDVKEKQSTDGYIPSYHEQTKREVVNTTHGEKMMVVEKMSQGYPSKKEGTPKKPLSVVREIKAVKRKGAGCNSSTKESKQGSAEKMEDIPLLDSRGETSSLIERVSLDSEKSKSTHEVEAKRDQEEMVSLAENWSPSASKVVEWESASVPDGKKPNKRMGRQPTSLIPDSEQGLLGDQIKKREEQESGRPRSPEATRIKKRKVKKRARDCGLPELGVMEGAEEHSGRNWEKNPAEGRGEASTLGVGKYFLSVDQGTTGEHEIMSTRPKATSKKKANSETCMDCPTNLEEEEIFSCDMKTQVGECDVNVQENEKVVMRPKEKKVGNPSLPHCEEKVEGITGKNYFHRGPQSDKDRDGKEARKRSKEDSKYSACKLDIVPGGLEELAYGSKIETAVDQNMKVKVEKDIVNNIKLEATPRKKKKKRKALVDSDPNGGAGTTNSYSKRDRNGRWKADDEAILKLAVVCPVGCGRSYSSRTSAWFRHKKYCTRSRK